MTWWIAFTIAVLGWYFTARQNAKNSSRTLINQEVKETRSKLHELIVACSSKQSELPLKPMSEDYIKMQTYIVLVQELDKLYSSYHLPYFRDIRIVGVPLTFLAKLKTNDVVKNAREFFIHWFIPQSYASALRNDATFDLSEHILNIRQSLTDDMKDEDGTQRIDKLNFEYKRLCMNYQFVS
ncbi:hypothetical protein J7Y46_003843 [Vibrio parahaemolyticus]|nr:hypothetical protein [Vibrio parahaemolyticus]EHK2874684.1 hypothetical protein [Vibrio parahaemolyticus]EHK2923985.1 hypothetical protein [Vibrio parahaemolyticus]EHK4785944.1 hypothetical protein [Vibrio parahaemolyticus]EHV9722915.1 hypothetical protein [Vibrio parahaemolyticus]